MMSLFIEWCRFTTLSLHCVYRAESRDVLESSLNQVFSYYTAQIAWLTLLQGSIQVLKKLKKVEAFAWKKKSK